MKNKNVSPRNAWGVHGIVPEIHLRNKFWKKNRVRLYCDVLQWNSRGSLTGPKHNSLKNKSLSTILANRLNKTRFLMDLNFRRTRPPQDDQTTAAPIQIGGSWTPLHTDNLHHRGSWNCPSATIVRPPMRPRHLSSTFLVFYGILISRNLEKNIFFLFVTKDFKKYF